jgi:prepilin-type N-terminal cleavage/methylation domain-containing protein
MTIRPGNSIRQQRGFTLIEMLASITLMGLMAGLLLPNFQKWAQRTQQKVDASAILMQLQKLQVRAALLGQDIDLDEKTASLLLADGQPVLQLPQGWRLMPNQSPWRMHASGSCANAQIRVANADQHLEFESSQDNCDIQYKPLAVQQP